MEKNQQQESEMVNNNNQIINSIEEPKIGSKNKLNVKKSPSKEFKKNPLKKKNKKEKFLIDTIARHLHFNNGEWATNERVLTKALEIVIEYNNLYYYSYYQNMGAQNPNANQPTEPLSTNNQVSTPLPNNNNNNISNIPNFNNIYQSKQKI
ncbi:hypothetical protein PPL_08976 [Heterostelium album PN500]|uniref:Uncharacterized protein n=1 Tax=Heterostelium pallidum (strain ATCC 26659 / Pp 5 / PN500) TaxID=670386 RepID=D3BK95_HETP5|nr:hypothetical protein PPL_08976 [Heterostelium album PN500]EFA78325.1 hypothetical protein PPL_08976 [Heterostelium album PN500]|eukprot:XP_020430450.1 hypothetical protein PPL_08976 [Heterostelium album PN500]